MGMSLAISRLGALALVAGVAASTACAQPLGSPRSKTKTRVYISTYAGADGDGIYLAELDPESGDLKLVRSVAALNKASFLVLHPSRGYLYSTSSVDEFEDSQGGALSAFKVDAATGNLTPLNHQSSAGAGPCYVSLDREGRCALVANYDGGSVAVLPIGADGKLGPATATIPHHGSSVNKDRQTGPHPHAIDVDRTNRFAFVPDLGLDKVLIYPFDGAAGTLAQNEPRTLTTKPGAGPRHLAFHANGRWAYFINELDSTITALQLDSAHGAFEPIETVSTLPDGAAVDNITGEIVIHPNGKFLYGSNRGHDSIAAYAIDQATGRLTSLGQHPAGGRVPRNFNIDPSGQYLLSANLDSNSVTVHRIDVASGKLSRTAHEIKLSQPYCVILAP